MKNLKAHLPHFFAGLIFAFILSRVGATSFQAINDMFLFRDFQLYGVIGGAIAVALPGLWILRRLKERKKISRPLRFPSHRLTPGTLPGAALFGLGWAVTGTCPGPAVVQLGEGHWAALATVAGIFLGNFFYGRLHQKYFRWMPDTCG
jgi:uncharacterized membrane protein YedE/YeeE